MPVMSVRAAPSMLSDASAWHSSSGDRSVIAGQQPRPISSEVSDFASRSGSMLVTAADGAATRRTLSSRRPGSLSTRSKCPGSPAAPLSRMIEAEVSSNLAPRPPTNANSQSERQIRPERSSGTPSRERRRLQHESNRTSAFASSHSASTGSAASSSDATDG
eukprot:scaffold305662_cov33-Tisochrysis_lutea.AAC.4